MDTRVKIAGVELEQSGYDSGIRNIWIRGGIQ